MKAITVLSLMLSLVSIAAQAAPVALLKYSTQNGSVNPMYGTRIDCEILDNETVSIRTIVGDLASYKTKKIKWNDIRNEAVLKSLIVDAESGQYDYPHTMYPIGASVYKYTAGLNGAEFVLLTKVGNTVKVDNTAKSAKRLVAFLNANCK
jgi:hypothetical protein